MPDYTQLDNAICLRIERGGCHPCNDVALEEMARRIAPKRSVPWRLIDSRMQAMRKSGRIRLTGKPRKWVVWSSATPGQA